jgi:hypothetical protein
MIIIVKNCDSCPLQNEDLSFGVDCNLYVKNKVPVFHMEDHTDKIIPKNCPLRKEEIVVTVVMSKKDKIKYPDNLRDGIFV